MKPSLSLSFFQALFGLTASVFAQALVAQPADFVVQHINVITIDTNSSRAQAFAVAGGKFVAVGSDEAVRKFIGPETKVLELTGKTVLPGFIDAHLHPQPLYPKESCWANVDCSP